MAKTQKAKTPKPKAEKPTLTITDPKVPENIAEIIETANQPETKVYDHTKKTILEVFGVTEAELEQERIKVISEAVGMKRSEAVEYLIKRMDESEIAKIYVSTVVTGLLFK